MKRMYQLVSLLAVILLLSLGGGLGYLWGTGQLNGERVEQIAAVLRGEIAGSTAAPTTAPASQPAVDRGLDATAERMAQSREQAEIYRRLLDREIQVAGRATSLAQQMRVELERRAEKLEREREVFAAQQAAAADQATTSGFQKDLNILKKLSAKQGKTLLMKRPEADAIRILSAMSERAAGQILGACKTEAENAWADSILQGISKTNDASGD